MKTNYKYTSLGKWVRHFCVDQDLTLSDLGKVLGISTSGVTLMCQGKKEIAPNLRSVLVERYGLEGEKLEQLDNFINNDPFSLIGKLTGIVAELDQEDLDGIQKILSKHAKEETSNDK